MTDGQFDEIHEISKRLDRFVGTVKWLIMLLAPAALLLAVAGVNVTNRITSLEASRDATSETIQRIDRNVEDLARYLREGSR